MKYKLLKLNSVSNLKSSSDWYCVEEINVGRTMWSKIDRIKILVDEKAFNITGSYNQTTILEFDNIDDLEKLVPELFL